MFCFHFKNIPVLRGWFISLYRRIMRSVSSDDA